MNPRYVIIFLAIVLALCTVFTMLVVFAINDTTYSVVLGICWVAMLMGVLCVVMMYLKQRRENASLHDLMEAKSAQLSESLIATETRLGDRIREAASIKADYERQQEISSSFKTMVSQLRSDVREMSAREQEFAQIIDDLRQRAEQSDRIKAAFLAMINHELRTPMNAIMGFSSFLGSPHLTDERRQQYISIISQSCERFLDTVNDVLYYSKLQSGDVDAEGAVFDLNSVLDNVVNLASGWVRSQNKPISVSISSRNPGKAYVRGFEAGFIKILTNLLHNSVKFTHSGCIIVGYTISHGVVTFEVADTGIGFDMGKGDYIFGSFNQGDSYLSRNFEGTGLGLSICRALVRLMGGDIHAESHPGVGSRFWFEVPVQDDATIEDDDVFARAERALSSIDKKKNRILVVTPFAEDYDTVANFYRPYGIEAVRCATLDEAVLRLDEFSDIATAFVDIYRSQKDEVEFVGSLYKANPKVRVVFMAEGELDAGYQDRIGVYSSTILHKPISSYDISKQVG